MKKLIVAFSALFCFLLLMRKLLLQLLLLNPPFRTLLKFWKLPTQTTIWEKFLMANLLNTNYRLKISAAIL